MANLGILISFLPWIIFWVVSSPSTWRFGAFGALLAAVILMIPSIERRAPKLFDIGTVAFFLVIALLSLFLDRQDARWLEDWSQTISTGALALIAIVSIAIGRPFTLQYAKEHAPREIWTAPTFVRTNYVISGVWAGVLTLAAILGAIGELVDNPTARDWLEWILPIALLVCAIKFTSWYPEHVRARTRDDGGAQATTTAIG